MSSDVIKALQEIVSSYGPSICDNAGRCKALLMDLCPTHRLEVNLLVVALQEGVPNRLASSPPGVPLVSLLATLALNVSEGHGLKRELARWAVETWAVALGVIDAGDITELPRLEAKPVEEPPPKAEPVPEVETRAGLIRTFTGHGHWVLSVAFSPDGCYALSGSQDNTLKLWDVNTGREIRTFTGHSDGVQSVAFSPDGRYALSGSQGNILKLWALGLC